MDKTKEQILSRALAASEKAAREAGAVIMEIYQSGFSVKEKPDHSPVTEADLRANEMILRKLKAEFPDFAFLSEESKDDKTRRENPWCFVIDPLDGTKEFVKHSDEFTVNIALVYQGSPLMGVIYLPALGDLYFAVRGKGAFVKTKKAFEQGMPARRIRVSGRTEEIRACVSKSSSPPNIGLILEHYGIHHIIYAGSALKGCLIASGKAEIYYREGRTCEWDTAAMQCIVQEAGGLLRQMDDTEMTYNRENVINEKGFYILNREENKLKQYSEQ